MDYVLLFCGCLTETPFSLNRQKPCAIVELHEYIGGEIKVPQSWESKNISHQFV